jgi:hypothetical protein
LTGDSYGTGWKCDRGYHADKDACIAVEVPANGYLIDASHGSGWQCERGYRAADEACIAIKVPSNGYLTDALRVGLEV